MASPATGGRGSNQYATKPGGQPGASRTAGRPLAMAVAAPDPDAEETAWAFNPEKKVWEAHAFDTWRAALPWRQAGYSPEAAAGWRSSGFSHPKEVEPWVREEWTWEDAGEWRARGFEDPRQAAQWQDNAVTAAEWEQDWKSRGFERDDVEWAEAVSHAYIVRDPAAFCQAWCDAGFEPDEMGRASRDYQMHEIHHPAALRAELDDGKEWGDACWSVRDAD